MNEKESIKKEKYLDSKTQNNSGIVDENIEISEKDINANISDTSNDESKIQKNDKTQFDIN